VTDPLVARLRAAGCVFAEDEAALLRDEAPDGATLEDWVRRREAGEPLEVLVGWAQFDGLRVRVAPGVFVPRARTALLVREAVDHLTAPGAGRAADAGPPVVVDLCCGTGAVGLAVTTRLPGTVLHAVDLDPAAVACARVNLAASGSAVHEGDLDAPLPAELRGRVDVLVANAPYVPTEAIADMPPEARDHEARVALDGGADGLDVLRRVIAVAPAWLAPGGVAVVEVGRTQVEALAAAARAAGLVPRVAQDPDLGATALVCALSRRRGAPAAGPRAR
jgi:release factor glutamine methyltransferase